MIRISTVWDCEDWAMLQLPRDVVEKQITWERMCTIPSTFKWRGYYHDWEYFLAPGIDQSFILKFLKKFHKSCTMTLDHCNYTFMRQWVIKYFVIRNRFQKEFENHCFEENTSFLGARVVLSSCLWCCNCEVACDLISGVHLFALRSLASVNWISSHKTAFAYVLSSR